MVSAAPPPTATPTVPWPPLAPATPLYFPTPLSAAWAVPTRSRVRARAAARRGARSRPAPRARFGLRGGWGGWSAGRAIRSPGPPGVAAPPATRRRPKIRVPRQLCPCVRGCPTAGFRKPNSCGSRGSATSSTQTAASCNDETRAWYG